MDKNYIFKAVQDFMRTPPLFLIGTGGSIPYDLPGMAQLAVHLKTAFTPKYAQDSSLKDCKRGAEVWSRTGYYNAMSI